MELKILPGNISNMIAAGEVVLRPASVVKELVENAVDAGATDIKVIITDSGRTLIQVIDNGCGMSPDDAVLCFERHATSKISSAEDLQDIMTFGFRGEALPSIAAVADVTLRTRREEDEVGCEVEFADSRQLSAKQVSTPKGSNFAVRDLFYNTPARRKFLKSDNVEFRHIIEEFTRIALTRPDIGFSLTHNNRDIYVLRPAKSLKFRILDLLGSNVAGDLVDIHAETSYVKIEGYAGRPDTAKKTLGNQFFFINGRYIRSPYLHKAVMKAYEQLIPEGVTPSYFLYLSIDPHCIDVNISPTKTEVKFEDESVIFQTVFASVRQVLGKNSFAGDIDFDREGAPEIPVLGKNFSEFRQGLAPQTDFDPNYNPFDRPRDSQGSFDFSDYSGGSGRQAGAGDPFSRGGMQEGRGGKSEDWGGAPGSGTPGNYSKYVDKREDYGKLFEQKTLPSTQILILQGRYILAPARSGVMILNVQRARERVFYDRFLEAVSKNGHVSQVSLFPVQVQVGAANKTVFDDNEQLLKSLGFDITSFGNDTVVVNGVPEGFSSEESKVQAMLADILIALTDSQNSLPDMLAAATAQKMAGVGAKCGSALTSPVEAQNLIDAVFASSNPEFTPSGKRITALASFDQIDKLF